MFAKLLKHTADPWWVALVTVAATLPACWDNGGRIVGRQSEAVVFGQRSGSDDDAVLQVVFTTPMVIGRCTGTLLASNLVITARHCVSAYVDRPFTCTPEGELAPGSLGGQVGALATPSQVTVRVGPGPNPAFAATAQQLFALPTPSICRSDIALIVLDKHLTNLPIVPVRLQRGTLPLEQVRLVGYGLDQDGGFGIRNERTGVVISQVGPSPFRDPGDAIPPRTFVTDGPALCIGDSGGPAFAGNTVLSGVFSQVVGGCTSTSARNFFSEVAPFSEELVLPAFKAAGAEPWLEGTAGPALFDPSAGAAGASESVSAAGNESVAGADGQSDAGADRESDAGAGGSSDPYHLPRNGGCTCGLAGAAGGSLPLPAALLIGLMLYPRLRRRCRRARRVSSSSAAPELRAP